MPSVGDEPLKISRWDKFRAKHDLEIRGVFSQQVGKRDGGPMRVGLAPLGVVLAKVFTVGLVNIGWRIQQERRRAKRLNKVVKFTENHSSLLERKINIYVDLGCSSLSSKPHQNFREDF
jgi:hypothetical protein